MITELRALQKLQQIVPVLVRHLDAYVELAQQDLAAAGKALIAKTRALVLLAISAVFAITMLCLLLIAATWDGEYRLVAIGGLAAVFLVIATIAAVTLTRRRPEGAFATLRREWRQDRAVFEAWLARGKEEEEHAPGYADHATHTPHSRQTLHTL